MYKKNNEKEYDVKTKKKLDDFTNFLSEMMFYQWNRKQFLIKQLYNYLGYVFLVFFLFIILYVCLI